MVILAESKDSVFDTNDVESIYVSSINIKVNFKSGRGCMIATYESKDMAQLVLKNIFIAISENCKSFMLPTTQELKQAVSMTEIVHLTPIRYHGKKPKSHGGS